MDVNASAIEIVLLTLMKVAMVTAKRVWIVIFAYAQVCYSHKTNKEK